MHRFENVRLRNGCGWVRPESGAVTMPGEGEGNSATPTARQGAIRFRVVDMPRPIALISNQGNALSYEEAEEKAALDLLRAGFAIVVWIGPEGPGAAVAQCYSALEYALDEAACALWTLKRLSGADEPPLMTFVLTHVEKIDRSERMRTVRARDWAWISVRGEAGAEVRAVDATRLRPDEWSALQDDLSHMPDPSRCAVLLVDIDWTRAYADVAGHLECDLMMARVHACIERAAMREKSTFVRIDRDVFAAIIRGNVAQAQRIAEDVRRDVEAMNIPFNHPEVKTHGRVTVSAAALAQSGHSDLRKALEDAVRRAKQSGRNAVAKA